MDRGGGGGSAAEYIKTAYTPGSRRSTIQYSIYNMKIYLSTVLHILLLPINIVYS